MEGEVGAGVTLMGKGHLQVIILGHITYETFNHRLKIWDTWQQVWMNKIHKQGVIVNAISTRIQYGIESNRPLFQIDGYETCVLHV